MKTLPSVVLGVVGLVLVAVGGSLYAIKGSLSLMAAGCLWVGLMLSLFVLYARFGDFRYLLGKKSARYGANMAIMVAVFFLITVFIAILGESHKKRVDFTKTGRFTLSPQTVKILKTLDQPVKAVAFYRSEAGTVHAKQRQMAKDLLDEYSSLSENFSYTFIDPDRNPAVALKYGVSEYRIILLTSGPKRVKIANEREEMFTNSLIRLLQEKQKTIYFVKGHGEKEITSTKKNGYIAVANALVGQNFLVNELYLAQAPEIPEDASVVIVPSPARDFAPEELEKLDAYYKSGGAMMVAIDPGHPPAFKTWLESYGFKLQDDVIIDQESQVYGANYLTPVVHDYNKKHPLTQDFSMVTYFPISNSVYIDEDPKKGRYQLAFTGPNSWTEMDKEQLESGDAEYNEESEKRGPVSMMAVTTITVKGAKTPDGFEQNKYGKFILIGDSDFANNTNFNLAGNGDLFMNTVSWLSEEANLIAVRARKRDITPVILTATQGRAIFWIPVVMIPASILLAGIGIYSRRRWFR